MIAEGEHFEARVTVAASWLNATYLWHVPILIIYMYIYIYIHIIIMMIIIIRIIIIIIIYNNNIYINS